jgi:polysaccharide biosynthesis protein PslG
MGRILFCRVLAWRLGSVVLGLLLAALLGVATAARAAEPLTGIGDQQAAMLSDPFWQELALPRVRYVVAWDALHWREQRDEADAYLAAARAAGADVLLSFGHSRVRSRVRVLPSPGRFRREFLRFRARYPWVHEFLTWNEANHCSQPTCRRPDVAARYYNALRHSCRGCTIVAADVLDTRAMPAWARAFRRRAVGRHLIWGLHNYIDANRFRTRGTRSLLRAVPGEVWFTETGGLVERNNGSQIEFPENKWHAARATKWVFQRLARLSPRVRRIYLYQWTSQPDATWDSGLVDVAGRPRPAYWVLTEHLRAVAERSPRR